jgi:hypothetical protein
VPLNEQRARPLTKGGPGTAADDQKADAPIVASDRDDGWPA